MLRYWLLILLVLSERWVVEQIAYEWNVAKSRKQKAERVAFELQSVKASKFSFNVRTRWLKSHSHSLTMTLHLLLLLLRRPTTYSNKAPSPITPSVNSLRFFHKILLYFPPYAIIFHILLSLCSSNFKVRNNYELWLLLLIIIIRFLILLGIDYLPFLVFSDGAKTIGSLTNQAIKFICLLTFLLIFFSLKRIYVSDLNSAVSKEWICRDGAKWVNL